MDKIINKNIDAREKLDTQIKSDLESFYKGLDFKALVDNTEEYLREFSMQFIQDVMPEYANRYIQLGLKFGKEAKAQTVEYQSKRAVEQNVEGFGSD
jgi:hypothetical protein